MTSLLNTAFLQLSRRAERIDPLKLVQTFVDVGPLFTMLSSADHQILYGRRGTGKTHALAYLAQEVRGVGDVAVYVDMRMIGSTGGIYADPSIAITDRGTRLLLDALGVIHNELVDVALNASYEGRDTAAAFALLDRLADEIAGSVRVVGPVQLEDRSTSSSSSSTNRTAEARLSSDPSIAIGGSRASTADHVVERRVQREGVEQHRVHFGAVSGVIRDVIAALDIQRLWILIDEWSSTPLDLQPLLADLIRRSLLPVAGVTVKLAAIEQRSEFRVPLAPGDHLGIEVGADVAADINLDDFMVFGNDADRAKDFFLNLLHRHVVAALAEDDRSAEAPPTAQSLLARAFTQRSALDEFVRAAEGVPRDAINIIAMAAGRANDDVISVGHLRAAARLWYQRDKEPALAEEARELLAWIISEVIGERQARAFMLRQGEDRRHPLIQSLYDARVLHLIRRGIAARDQPGVRFNGWGLDYGCYVDLINTVRAPRGLFEVEPPDAAESFVEVPSDDYRSIRRAILDLSAFESRQPPLSREWT